jgi:hypothetical protein
MGSAAIFDFSFHQMPGSFFLRYRRHRQPRTDLSQIADDSLSFASKAAVVSSLVRVSLLVGCSGIAVVGHSSRCHTRNRAVKQGSDEEKGAEHAHDGR